MIYVYVFFFISLGLLEIFHYIFITYLKCTLKLDTIHIHKKGIKSQIFRERMFTAGRYMNFKPKYSAYSLIEHVYQPLEFSLGVQVLC